MTLLHKAGTMFFENDEIIEFDINPVILYEKGAFAVDARIYVKSGETSVAKPRSSFHLSRISCIQNP